MLIILIFIGSLIGAFIFALIAEYSKDNFYMLLELISKLITVILIISALIFGIASIFLAGKENDNKAEFLSLQQEYKVLIQYINSEKSDSIIENTYMMNKIKEYNDKVINKQNDMNRPLMKYYTKGANWNELKLVDLNKGE